MHAQVNNLVTCADGECVQPGTEFEVVGRDSEDDDIVLEFCTFHFLQRQWDATQDWQPVARENPLESPVSVSRDEGGESEPDDGLAGV